MVYNYTKKIPDYDCIETNPKLTYGRLEEPGCLIFKLW